MTQQELADKRFNSTFMELKLDKSSMILAWLLF